jgi:phosphatidate phosphatase APP1
MELELVEPTRIAAAGEVFLPPENCRYVVISDIDDTVMETGVASKARMLWRLFMQGAESRVAFPGVAALLQALHRGASGVEANPMLYVSRAPWSLYEVLGTFFNLHRIPVGPILFLREWGLTLQSPLPRRAQDHKLQLIRHILALYRDLPFILIGDSGQRDPEIYTQIVHEHPGRALAIYIRNVSRDPERHRAIEALAHEVVEAGSRLLLAADSLAIAQHAAAHGLIAPGMLVAVAHEREVEQGEPGLSPEVAIAGSSQDTAARMAQAHQASDRELGAVLPQEVAVEAAPQAGEPGVDERARRSALREQVPVGGERRESGVR